jgi:uncharacterized protein with FMN-binding domain
MLLNYNGMKKGIIAILAVAIIGALTFYGKNSSGPPPASSNNPGASVQSASTSDNPGSSASSNQAGYKDGTYTGDSEETPYGTVQVAVIVSGGKITDVNFLQMPNDRGHTQEVTAFAEPYLKQQTLQKQSAHIDFVSGATSTSDGYEQSLQSALDRAA